MTKLVNIWDELSKLCITLHKLLYLKRDIDAARVYLPQLKLLLERIPRNTIAIVAAEGRAIYHELHGDIRRAIVLRAREVALMKRLYEDMRKNKYDELTRKYMLQRRNHDEFEMRKKILMSLRRKEERGLDPLAPTGRGRVSR